MFESLADQIKHDNREQYTTAERVVEWAVSLVIAVVVFGGVYMAIHLLAY